MASRINNLRELYPTTRFFVAGGIPVVFMLAGFFIPALLVAGQALLAIYLMLVIAEIYLLTFTGRIPTGTRIVPERMSNGDENPVRVNIRNRYPFVARCILVDELPEQFQERTFRMVKYIKPFQETRFRYTLRPTERGAYLFGDILAFMQTRLGLLSMRHRIEAETEVHVFPSFMHLRSQSLVSPLTIAGSGNTRVRKIGQSMEFEQIKEYALGDDIRTLNWKATARRGGLMVNSFMDERSQQLICVVDKGRLMKMPFDGLSLLDHSINSVLALANLGLKKQDKVGLFTFSNKAGTMVPPDRQMIQRQKIMQALYREETGFLESDFEMLYLQLRQRVKQRSLVMLFTNFESVSGLQRQIPYLRSISRHHLLLVVCFENAELQKLSMATVKQVDDVYVKAIAEQISFEKRQIVKELGRYGIRTILTTPAELTTDVLNKYLQVKSLQIL